MIEKKLIWRKGNVDHHLRGRLLPKNFYLEKRVFLFGHMYGALNVIKQQN